MGHTGSSARRNAGDKRISAAARPRLKPAANPRPHLTTQQHAALPPKRSPLWRSHLCTQPPESQSSSAPGLSDLCLGPLETALTALSQFNVVDRLMKSTSASRVQGKARSYPDALDEHES
ncbi:unnamed protein product [Gadus morhua 'NCC']